MVVPQITFRISVSTRVDQHESAVAFHAELGPHKRNLSTGQIIKFEHVKQNYGNAYDPQTGIFTSPKSALYFFTFTILTFPGQHVETKLVVNGSPVAYSFSQGPYPDIHNSGSKSVVVPLHPGDRVWLEFYFGDNNVSGDYWSTLTGYII